MRRGNLTRNRNLIYQDTRSVQEANKFLKEFGHEYFYSITGGAHTPAIYPLFKIMWLKENEPDVYRLTARFLQAKSYIIQKFTNNFITDFSDASQTGMLDIKNMCWSREILHASGVPEDKLPELGSATDIVGYVSTQAASQTSLLKGTPVVNGGGDVLCACAGAGAIEEGTFYMNIGSAGWWGTTTEQPIFDFDSRLLCLAHVVSHAYAPHLTMYNGANCEQWIRKIAFSRENNSAGSNSTAIFSLIEREVKSIQPGSGNLIFLPYLTGAGAPIFDPYANGAFIGLSMEHDKRHLYRAVLEGVAFQLRMIYEVFKNQQHDIHEIRIIGGGAESNLWRQILADTLQRTLSVPENPREASCLGAAMAGGVGVGMFEDFIEAK